MARAGLSSRTAGELLGVTHTAANGFVKDGYLKRLPDGSICPASVEKYRLERLARAGKPVASEVQPGETPETAAERIVIEQGHAPYTLAEAERIKENFLAKLKELEFDLKSGEVVRVADVMKVVATQYAIVRNRMLSIPAEVAPRAAMLNSAPEVQAFIQAEIVEALEALALDLATSAEGLRRALH